MEVINCPNSSACSDTFTSRLSYNASCSRGTNIQIGCSSAVNQSTCSPERDPPDTEFVTLLVTNCTGIYIQDLKNIKNVKRCRDGMPKSMQTR